MESAVCSDDTQVLIENYEGIADRIHDRLGERARIIAFIFEVDVDHHQNAGRCLDPRHLRGVEGICEAGKIVGTQFERGRDEVVRSACSSGLVREETGAFVLTGSLPPLAIPTTLHASLLARLDRLAPVREVAQIAAALGRQFSHEIITSVASVPEEQLRDALDQLVAAELIFRRGRPPNAEYMFKHVLVQEAAYSTLLRSQRQLLHARIATTLEPQFPDIATSQPEIVARHYSEASLSETALKWWRQAAERALNSSACNEAIAHLEKALGIAAALADGPANRLLQLCVVRG